MVVSLKAYLKKNHNSENKMKISKLKLKIMTQNLKKKQWTRCVRNIDEAEKPIESFVYANLVFISLSVSSQFGDRPLQQRKL